MIGKLRAYLLHKRMEAMEKFYQRGFDYAAGQLLQFRHDPSMLKRVNAEAHGVPGERGAAKQFSHGMLAAIANFESMQRSLNNDNTIGH